MNPTVAEHRDMADPDGQGGLVRQQAAQFCELASKYQLIQQVGETTRGEEILDLIWSSNPDLVSTVHIDPFQSMTDHSVVTATTSYRIASEEIKERSFLLESGRRFHKLDLSKAPWAEIKRKLGQADWLPMETLAKTNVIAAHSLFVETVLHS